jgi:hypothetical protein
MKIFRTKTHEVGCLGYYIHRNFEICQCEGKVTPSLNYLRNMPLRHMGDGGIAPPFLVSALDGDDWSASSPWVCEGYLVLLG